MNTLTRQVRRQEQRIYDKDKARFDRGMTNGEGKSKQKMNPVRDTILKDISKAMALYFAPPETVADKDKLSYAADQLHKAHELNNEWMERSKGKGGKKPRTQSFIPSIALRVDRTNPIGHFA